MEKWKEQVSRIKIKNSFSDMLSLRYLSDTQVKTI